MGRGVPIRIWLNSMYVISPAVVQMQQADGDPEAKNVARDHPDISNIGGGPRFPKKILLCTSMLKKIVKTRWVVGGGVEDRQNKY